MHSAQFQNERQHDRNLACCEGSAQVESSRQLWYSKIALLGGFGFNLFRVAVGVEGLPAFIRGQVGFQFYRFIADVADEL
jgi:hypothetical protein